MGDTPYREEPEPPFREQVGETVTEAVRSLSRPSSVPNWLVALLALGFLVLGVLAILR